MDIKPHLWNALNTLVGVLAAIGLCLSLTACDPTSDKHIVNTLSKETNTLDQLTRKDWGPAHKWEVSSGPNLGLPGVRLVTVKGERTLHRRRSNRCVATDGEIVCTDILQHLVKSQNLGAQNQQLSETQWINLVSYSTAQFISNGQYASPMTGNLNRQRKKGVRWAPKPIQAEVDPSIWAQVTPPSLHTNASGGLRVIYFTSQKGSRCIHCPRRSYLRKTQVDIETDNTVKIERETLWHKTH